MIHGKIKGIIFDMDGVISDTQRLHSEVESAMLREIGIGISPEDMTRRFAGTKTEVIFKQLFEEQSKVYDMDELMKIKWNRMNTLAEFKVEPIEGSIALVRKLAADGYPLTVASSSPRSYVELVIEKLGLTKYFVTLVTGDMVTKSKPDPEIFLLASEKIGVDPKSCLVIEDSKSGMRAARSAGMFCVGLVESLHGEYPTNNLVLKLSEISDEYIQLLKN